MQPAAKNRGFVAHSSVVAFSAAFFQRPVSLRFDRCEDREASVSSLSDGGGAGQSSFDSLRDRKGSCEGRGTSMGLAAGAM